MEKTVVQETRIDPALLKLLDRGIDDVRAGRTLPHEEAFEAVRRIRDARREERKAEQAAER